MKVALLFLILFPLFTWQDKVILKTGRSIEGKVVVQDEKHVVLEVKYGKIDLPMSQVKEIIIGKDKIPHSDPSGFTPAKSPATKKRNKKTANRAGGSKRLLDVSPPKGPATPILTNYKKKAAGGKDLDQDLVNTYRKKLVELGGLCIPELHYEIKNSGDWKVKHLAVTTLRWLKDPRGIPALLEALKDRTVLGHSWGGVSANKSSKYYIRKNAAFALKDIGSAAKSVLIKTVSRGDYPDRVNAVYALCQFEAMDVTKLLVSIAKDKTESSEIRIEAAFGIAGKTFTASRACANKLEEEKLREGAAAALENARDMKAVPFLMNKVRKADRDFESAEFAAKLISHISKEKFYPEAISDCVDYSMLANQGTRKSIDRRFGKDAIPRLTWWAKATDREMRLLAIEAFFGFKDRGVGDLMLDMMDDPDKDVRYKAVMLLKCNKDYRVMEKLIRKADTDKANRKRYLALLNHWTHQKLGDDTKKWLNWWRTNKNSFNN